jgi:ABC-three component (ABC-3C) system Middle Component 3
MKPNMRHFEVWLSVNPEIKVGLATRASSLVPFTRETLGFLQRSGTLTIRETDAAWPYVRVPGEDHNYRYDYLIPSLMRCLERGFGDS